MNVQFNLSNCDQEPIHIPGAIQPHGAMLVIDCDTCAIVQAAGDTSGLLGHPIDAILGLTPETLLRADQIDLLRELSAEASLTTPRY
jgi:two-component system, chemotaxis family, sensor kinase Cph1